MPEEPRLTAILGVPVALLVHDRLSTVAAERAVAGAMTIVMLSPVTRLGPSVLVIVNAYLTTAPTPGMGGPAA